jgi:hypothetical protein
MSIQAKVIADSKSIRGERLTTFLLTFPRIILSEFNTHRMFSRNSASSRAIPFAKMVESVETNPFIPIAWQKHHHGMQGAQYFDSLDTIKWVNMSGNISAQKGLTELWLEASGFAISCAQGLNQAGLTKQLANRLLEPFMWHTVICTATEYENFFKLRCPEYVVSWYPANRPEALEPAQASFRSKKDAIARTNGECDSWTEEDWRESNISQAEIHIQALAEVMWDAMNESTPKILHVGEWHIPFSDDLQVATARCARVSYTTVGSTSSNSHTADIELYNRLLESGHMSPFEHCAQVMEPERYFDRPYSRNFKGFVQYREIVEASLH